MLDLRRDRHFKRLGWLLGYEKEFQAGEADWGGDTDWLQLQVLPRSGRLLLYLIALLVAAALVWARLAVVDIVVQGAGKVIPSSHLKVVESQDGGRVRRILVHEGERVEQGQLLVELDPVRAAATLDEHRSYIQSLEAQAARLKALIDDEALDLPQKGSEVMKNEYERYLHEKQELEEKLSLARQKLQQERDRLRSTKARVVQLKRSLQLTREELGRLEPLLKQGAASDLEVLKLRRELAEVKGDLEVNKADMARQKSAVAEAEQRVTSVASEYRNRWRRELSETLLQLTSRRQALRALEDRARHTRIYAPVSGRVQRLAVNTPGEVVDPGGSVAEIVPGDDVLEIEARIRPQDIAPIRPGLPAQVKITAYRYTVHGGLDGEVIGVSPDTLVDQQGRAFYLVRIRTRQAGYGPDKPIVVGMMAEVGIKVGERRLLDYLLYPMGQLFENALREP